MENRRKFGRFDTKLKANCFLKERKGNGERCTITDISRRGMGVRFHARKKINIGSTVFLEIAVPTELRPVNVKGILRRINQRGNDFFGGIEWGPVDGYVK